MDLPFLRAFDPGTTTGWADFSDMGVILGMGQLSPKELDEWAIAEEPQYMVIVYESYTVYPNEEYLAINILRGSSPADEAIGAILLGARRKGVKKVVSQQANIKRTAQKWSGIDASKVPHAYSHSIDALNHGVYYLVRNKIVTIAQLRNLSPRNT